MSLFVSFYNKYYIIRNKDVIIYIMYIHMYMNMYVCTHAYYTAGRKDEVVSFPGKLMEQEITL